MSHLPKPKPARTGFEIAVVGMAGRFPGARNIDQFWRNLRDGVESISSFSDEEVAASGVGSDLLSNPNYVKASGVLEDVDRFDAAFFGYTPREAELMDPQHRFFLECAWEAMEHAGYDPQQYDGLIGVYAGSSMGSYLLPGAHAHPDLRKLVSGLQVKLGNDREFLTTRVSYKLDLKGPSVVIQTACSTSLVAVHVAGRGLLGGECDMALAGGVSVTVPQKAGYLYQKEGILSADGHCRAFDAAAGGTVSGSGVGIVVLKRLDDALADGDTVHAVLKGSAINNDGAAKVGYTAPSVDGEANAIAGALAMADVHPETISYVETHGTGTRLGDPIEIAALTQAFRMKTDRRRFCAIGALKTNVGHLDAAAGVASLIKTILAIEHRQLPPSLHFQSPNPELELDASPFFVNTKLREWKSEDGPLRAGVSSFGFGGTNAHVVLEQAPPSPPPSPSRPWHLLLLSAKTDSALATATDNLAEYLKQRSPPCLADVAYTLQVGRQAFRHRRMLLCHDAKDAALALETRDPARWLGRVHTEGYRPVGFMFTGQGAQYPNMGRELYQQEPVFREHLDHCQQVLKPILGRSLLDLLYPKEDAVDDAKRQLTETGNAQPAIFAVEYALAQLWIAWGVRPQAMIGHSIGEYVAACLAGVLSLDSALALVAERGRLMQGLDGGAMLSIPLPEPDVKALLGPHLALAAVNAPSLCVASGPTEAVQRLEHQLAEKNVTCRRLRTSHAFHSEMIDPVLEPFRRRVSQVTLHPPTMPYLSNVTGTWILPSEATDPDYWANHMRHTVRFAEGLGHLFEEPRRVLLEVGPGQTLKTLAMQHARRSSEHIVLSSLRHPQQRTPNGQTTLRSLGQLWLAGVSVDWSSLHSHQTRRRLPLPTYPFERKRFWLKPRAQPSTAEPSAKPGKRNADMADWFYIPSWKRTDLPIPWDKAKHTGAEASRWLLFADPGDLSVQLAHGLETAGHDVVMVTRGEQYSRVDDHRFTVNPHRRQDHDQLVDVLAEASRLPEHVVHAWAVSSHGQPRAGLESLQRSQDLVFHSLLHLAQALGKHQVTHPIRITALANNLHDVTGEDVICPLKATMLGPCQVIPREYPNLECRVVDIPWPPAGERARDRLVGQMLSELTGGHRLDGTVVAYRGHHRLAQTYEPARLTRSDHGFPGRADSGAYLITGGLGGIGWALADHLAAVKHARLILVGRTPFPEKREWNRWLSDHDDNDSMSRKIRKVQALEQKGAEVLVISADVANRQQMRDAVASARRQFGPIHGVIHAAGLPDGALIQRRTRDMSESVLAPKVAGTLILDRLLRDDPLDFFVLCSSLASVLGPAGQVAYTAANAFQDAFAHHRTQREGKVTTSINWDTWKEVGMAVSAARQLESQAKRDRLPTAKTTSATASDSLLGRHTRNDPEQDVFVSTFESSRQWVLREHRISGAGVLPGTAYLEMARAAFQPRAAGGEITIRQLLLLRPLVVRDGEAREVRTVIRQQQEAVEFQVTSRTEPEADWQQHARGTIARAERGPASVLDLAGLKTRLGQGFTPQRPSSKLIEAGPRWNSLKEVRWTANEGLALLELPKEFSGDLQQLALHPALLDVATAFLLGHMAKSNAAYLPFSYSGVHIRAPLPQRFFSFAKCLDETRSSSDTIRFGLQLVDDRGRELVGIDEYTLRRADYGKVLPPPPARAGSAGEPGAARPSDLLEHGLSSVEGVEVFQRCLASRLPQVLVSTRKLATLRRARRDPAASAAAETPAGAEQPRPGHARPQLSTAYVAPRNETEKTLGAIWQQLLGIEEIGICDDFFELGGHSLLALQVISRLREEFHVEIPMGSLFEAPTVAGLAERVEAIRWAAGDRPAAEAASANGREEFEV